MLLVSQVAFFSALLVVVKLARSIRGSYHYELARVKKPIGSTGVKFEGDKVRSYSKPYFFGSKAHKEASGLRCVQELPEEAICSNSNWAVVTTIFKPSASIERMISLDGWCLVIVGDTDTPAKEYHLIESDNENKVIFLDVAIQQKMFADFSDRLPLNHFSRKNIGYLYAIRHGAKLIFDFDDDNQLKLGEDPSLLALPQAPMKMISNKSDMLFFNLYPSLNVDHFSWPRGFPLTYIKNKSAHDAELVSKFVKPGDAGVFQSFADHDPDVDAIYRLTRPLPILLKDPPAMVTVPPGVFIPYNAQATLHTYEAFWALLLPASVNGRVSDIWRSYFAQRLFKELGLHVIYTKSLVTQIRNSHDYQADMEAERPLYSQTETLLTFLDGWDFQSSFLEEKVEMLWIALYEHGYIEESDVLLMQGWLHALQCSGYQMPLLKTGGEYQQALSPPIEKNEKYLLLHHSWEPFTGGLRSFGHFLELAYLLNRTAVIPNAIDGCIVSGTEKYYGCSHPSRTNASPHALSEYIVLDDWIGDKVKYITVDDFTNRNKDVSVGIQIQWDHVPCQFPLDSFSSMHGIINVAKQVCIKPQDTSLPEHILREKSILFWAWRGIDGPLGSRSSLDKANLLDISELKFQHRIIAEADSFEKKNFNDEPHAAVHIRFGKIALFLLDNAEEYKEGLSCILRKISQVMRNHNVSHIYLTHDVGSQPEYLPKMTPTVVRDLQALIQNLPFNISSYAGDPLPEFVAIDGTGGFLSFIEIELMTRASNLLLIGCSSFGHYAHSRAVHQHTGQVLEPNLFENCRNRSTVREELLSKRC